MSGLVGGVGGGSTSGGGGGGVGWHWLYYSDNHSSRAVVCGVSHCPPSLTPDNWLSGVLAVSAVHAEPVSAWDSETW